MPTALAETINIHALAGLFADRSTAIDRDLGFALARATLRLDDTLPADVYRLDVEDVPALQGHWRPGISTVLASRKEAESLGLARSYVEHATLGGAIEAPAGTLPQGVPQSRILNASQRFLKEIEAGIRANASAGFGFSEASAWLGQLAVRHPQLVAQVQQSLPILRVVELCRRLLDEGVSLAPARTLLEALVRTGDAKQDATQTVEAIRRLLRRQIVHAASRGADALPAFLLEPNVENRLTALSRMNVADLDATRPGSDLSGVTFARVIGAAANEARTQSSAPVLVTTSKVRAIAQAILKRHGVQIPVISLDEIGTETRIHPLRALTVAELGLA